MWAAGLQAVARLHQHARLKPPVEIEAETSQAAADVIFRTLFSLPITDQLAAKVFEQFKIYQRSQPLLNIAAFLKFPVGYLDFSGAIHVGLRTRSDA